jgi:hypothetical protein
MKKKHRRQGGAKPKNHLLGGDIWAADQSSVVPPKGTPTERRGEDASSFRASRLGIH